MNSKVFLICLTVTGLVSAAVVVFYAKKNPNPYFRPRKGELVMMSILFAIVSGITSFVFSQFFEADINLKRIAEQEERRAKDRMRSTISREASPAPGSHPGSETDAGENSSSPFGNARPDIPPFLEEQRR